MKKLAFRCPILYPPTKLYILLNKKIVFFFQIFTHKIFLSVNEPILKPWLFQDLLIMIDTTIQYGEDLDTKTRDFEYPDKEDENDE